MVHQERARTRESGTAGPEVRAAVVLLAAGGRRRSTWPMDALAERLGAAARPRGAEVRTARTAAGAADAAAVEAELDSVREEYGPVPALLVGAGPSARTALWAARHPAVSAVALIGLRLPDAGELAAEGEPVDQLTGRQVLMVDGGEDPATDPERALDFALRAQRTAERLLRFEVHGGRNPLRRRAADIRELVADWALSILVGTAPARVLDDAAAMPLGLAAGLRMPLQDGFTSRIR